MAAVWGDFEPTSDRMVNSMIKRIRAKIGAFGLEILTGYGEGYAIDREHAARVARMAEAER